MVRVMLAFFFSLILKWCKGIFLWSLIKELESVRSRYVDFRLDAPKSFSTGLFEMKSCKANAERYWAQGSTYSDSQVSIGKNWNESKTGNQLCKP